MSVYSTGVDAYRDTTKWLAAFVPIVALATATLVAGPRLVGTFETAPSLGSWFQDYWLILLCAVALFGGIAAILTTGARVLSVEPADIADLATDNGGPKALAGAIGSGVAAPEFFDKDSFDQAMAKLQAAADAGDIAADDPTMARLKPAIDALREWSVFSRIQGPFRTFRITFVISVVLIAAAVVIAPAQLGSSAAIDKPTKVDIHFDDQGRADLQAETGCSDPDSTSSAFYATGGTWDHPQLIAEGPGCRFADTWFPDPEHIEIRLPTSAPSN